MEGVAPQTSQEGAARQVGAAAPCTPARAYLLRFAQHGQSIDSPPRTTPTTGEISIGLIAVYLIHQLRKDLIIDAQTAEVAITDPDADLPEDIRRIPPEYRDAELRRLAESSLEREQYERRTRELCEFYGIPYP